MITVRRWASKKYFSSRRLQAEAWRTVIVVEQWGHDGTAVASLDHLATCSKLCLVRIWKSSLSIFRVIQRPVINNSPSEKRWVHSAALVALQPTDMKADAKGNTMLQSFVSKIFQKRSAEDILVPPLWEKLGKKSFLAYSRGCTQRNLCFHVENCQHGDRGHYHRTIDLRYRHIINPRPTRFVSGMANECTLMTASKVSGGSVA